MNTELIEKIGTDFRNLCDGQPCYECRYDLFRPNCCTAFTIDYLAEHGYLKERPEKATLSETETFAKNETVADNSLAPATLPKWVKVGQWVMTEEMEMWKIDRVNKGIINAIGADKALGCVCHWRDIKPTRFRPYTYEEAAKLIGKTMKYSLGGFIHAEMITEVVSDPGGKVLVNCCDFDGLTVRNATIDGLPIGVPEVDEEAMKGGEEWRE